MSRSTWPVILILSGFVVLTPLLRAQDRCETWHASPRQTDVGSLTVSGAEAEEISHTTPKANRDGRRPALIVAGAVRMPTPANAGTLQAADEPASFVENPAKTDVGSIAQSRAAQISAGDTFPAADSLNPDPDADHDAQDCIDGLCWNKSSFRVRIETAQPGKGDWTVRFPSPVTSGNERNDLVAMEWYVARDESGTPMMAPAVIVVHESGSSMPVGRLFARGLNQNGLHTCLIHLPFYGLRRTGRSRPRDVNLVSSIHQAVTDVRRARDAIAALPGVESDAVALQGTSLGGFVSATAGAIDEGYQSVFLLLAGGELFDIIQKGKKDAAKVRDELQKLGLTDRELRELVWKIEPTRISHRLPRSQTWLYSGSYDTVVPIENAVALAKAAGLDRTHHIRMAANHYSGIIYLPFVMKHMATRIHDMPRATSVGP